MIRIIIFDLFCIRLMTSTFFCFLTAALLPSLFSSAQAAEYPIGKPHIRNGMEIAAVYLQPVTMEPDGMMRQPKDSDIHLEADIQAVKNNPNGFAEGDWIPYLHIKFELAKVNTKQTVKGHLMPMVANDGPHYGDNVKLFGPGKYRLKYFIAPPAQAGHPSFGRHTDRETGVGPWFKPFQVEYEFVFVGVGKKGGY